MVGEMKLDGEHHRGGAQEKLHKTFNSRAKNSSSIPVSETQEVLTSIVSVLYLPLSFRKNP